jgi:hypothetical protein
VLLACAHCAPLPPRLFPSPAGELKGAFYLQHAVVGTAWTLPTKQPADKRFFFSVRLPDRSFYFNAADESTFRVWVSALERQCAACQVRARTRARLQHARACV